MNSNDADFYVQQLKRINGKEITGTEILPPQRNLTQFRRTVYILRLE